MVCRPSRAAAAAAAAGNIIKLGRGPASAHRSSLLDSLIKRVLLSLL
jgi:hypothetical protein